MTLRVRARLLPTAEQLARLESGEWSRAGGDARCRECGETYFDHPELALPPGSGWWAVACDGRLFKL